MLLFQTDCTTVTQCWSVQYRCLYHCIRCRTRPAALIKELSLRDHVTSALRDQLHWFYLFSIRITINCVFWRTWCIYRQQSIIFVQSRDRHREHFIHNPAQICQYRCMRTNRSQLHWNLTNVVSRTLTWSCFLC